MELREVLSALRVAWWLVALGIVVGGLAALAVSFVTTPVYTSQMQLFVSTTDSATSSDVYAGGQFSQQRVTSYARLLTGHDLLARVINQLHLHTTPASLVKNVTADPVTETVLLNVSVTDPSPQQAQKIAGAIASQFTGMVTELETPDGQALSPVKVTLVEAPDLPTRPSEPQTIRNIAIGLIAGALAGSGVAIARARMDASVHDAEEAETLASAPVIGTILRDDALVKNHVVDRAGNNRTAEDYRRLRTNLQFLNVDSPPKIIMISSAVPAEGKTTVTINLAVALTELGRSVTVVEADLRRPRVTRYLGLVDGVGLTNVLAGVAEVEDVVQFYGPSKMPVIAAGPTPPNPGELLASTHMATLLRKLAETNEFVLVDAPPLLPVADSSGLAASTDGVLLSVRYGSTRKDQVEQAAASVARVGAKVLGVVLNIVPPRAEIASAYGYGYEYGYDKTRSRHRVG